MRWILDFCGFCGALVPEGGAIEESPRCDECDNDIYRREHRIQGEFTEEEARRLHAAYFRQTA
jgi:hypothetical protein